MLSKEASPHPEEAHKVVRVFPFALRTPEDILADFKIYKDLKKKGKRSFLSLTEVYLVQKPQGTGGPSEGKIAPIGGGIQGDDNASTLEAAVAHIQRKTTFSCSPLENTEETREKFEVPGNINYSLIKNDRCFQANLVVVPVINPKILRAISPHPDDKIESFIALTTEELRVAIQNGKCRGIDLVGHITTKVERSDIVITREDREKRNLSLTSLKAKLKEIDDKNKGKLREKLIFLAIDKHLDIDIFEQVIDIDGKEKEQKISLEQLMLKIEEQCKTLDDFEALFNEAYGLLLSELYMDYFRSREMDTYAKLNEKDLEEKSKPKKPNPYERIFNLRIFNSLRRKIKGKGRLRKILRRRMESEAKLIEERMSDGNFGVDMLRILPLLISLDGVEKGKATRLILSGARLMRDLSKVCFGEERIEEMKKYYLNEDRDLGSKSEKTKIINSKLIDTLSNLFGKTQSEITNAWIFASRFIPKLPEDVTSISPELMNLFHVHEAGIEIELSSIGEIFLLSLGIDVREHNTKQWKKIKFEALRQMAIFLKTLFAKPFYEAEIKKAEEHPIKEALRCYFQDDDKLSGIYTLPEILGYQAKICVEYMKYKGKPIILDPKPVKSLTSFIRKALQTPQERIHDLVSVGIVLPGVIEQSLTEWNTEAVIEDIQARIAEIEEIKTGLELYYKEQFPSYEFKVDRDENTYENLLNYISSGKKIADEGKRTGSIASRIVRRRIYIVAKHKETKEEYFAEIAFYPLESLTDLTNGKLMGWVEKVADDPLYKIRRMFNPLGNFGIGMCSLYELLFPSSVYPQQVKEVRSSSTIFQYKKT